MQTVALLHAKRPVNLSLPAALLDEAKTLGINLSRTLEESLILAVRQRRQELWLEENRPAMADTNARIVRDGLFGDTERVF